MGHKIVEAIIENGQLKYTDEKLPSGRVKVHIIYDTAEECLSETEISKIVRETSGIYKTIDAEAESKRLRSSWERDVHN